MPPKRTGTVYYRASQGLWGGTVTVDVGVRRSFYAKTEAEVREKMAAAGFAPPLRSRRQPTDIYRSRVASLVAAVLRRARTLHWTDEMAAAVIAASLTVTRIRHEIVGPCTYCGDEFADSIDHAIPLARGGPDTAENRVSSCRRCNYSKGKRTVQEWIS